jgi:NOL1/NOP2/sun family putative RNA methylase
MQLEKLYARYQPIIPDYETFIEFLKRPLTPTFRFNTLKASAEETVYHLGKIRIQPLAFYRDGFSVLDRISLGNHFTHQLGLIYGQETASMVPVLVLDPKPGELVLDLCAAPGSKTTQIGQILDNRGLLVANEVNPKRRMGLLQNVKRCGLINEAVTGQRGEKIGRVLPDHFDRVLIDAPCSAEGTVRKSRAVLYHWGLKNIERMAWIQKGLIVSGFQALKPGGTMVYSTCTIAPEENEEVVDYLLQKYPDAEIQPISLPDFRIRNGVREWEKRSFDERVRECGRILPQDNDTAPFFLARITKRGETGAAAGFSRRIEFNQEAVQLLDRRFGIGPERMKGQAIFLEGDTVFVATPEAFDFREIKTLRQGLELGKVYGAEIKPDNDFVQIFGRTPARNFYEAGEAELVKFLRGEKIQSPAEPGFVIVTYKNLTVGVARANGRELKSAIERERRIS